MSGSNGKTASKTIPNLTKKDYEYRELIEAMNLADNKIDFNLCSNEQSMEKLLNQYVFKSKFKNSTNPAISKMLLENNKIVYRELTKMIRDDPNIKNKILETNLIFPQHIGHLKKKTYFNKSNGTSNGRNFHHIKSNSYYKSSFENNNSMNKSIKLTSNIKNTTNNTNNINNISRKLDLSNVNNIGNQTQIFQTQIQFLNSIKERNNSKYNSTNKTNKSNTKELIKSKYEIENTHNAEYKVYNTENNYVNDINNINNEYNNDTHYKSPKFFYIRKNLNNHIRKKLIPNINNMYYNNPLKTSFQMDSQFNHLESNTTEYKEEPNFSGYNMTNVTGNYTNTTTNKNNLYNMLNNNDDYYNSQTVFNHNKVTTGAFINYKKHKKINSINFKVNTNFFDKDELRELNKNIFNNNTNTGKVEALIKHKQKFKFKYLSPIKAVKTNDLVNETDETINIDITKEINKEINNRNNISNDNNKHNSIIVADLDLLKMQKYIQKKKENIDNSFSLNSSTFLNKDSGRNTKKVNQYNHYSSFNGKNLNNSFDYSNLNTKKRFKISLVDVVSLENLDFYESVLNNLNNSMNSIKSGKNGHYGKKKSNELNKKILFDNKYIKSKEERILENRTKYKFTKLGRLRVDKFLKTNFKI